MKRLILAGAMAVAACAGAPDPASTSAQLDGDRVVLATFTADVDPAAGTFVIRSAPTAAGRALQILDGDVTVANKVAAGNPFFNVAQGTGRACTDGYVGNVWGATVTITNNLADTILGGVYAEITSATPVAALQSCSSAGAPSGLSATPGLWSYAQIAASGTGEKDWVFKYTTATRFSFSGRIVGAKVTAADTTSGAQNAVNHGDVSLRAIVDLDPYMAVAAATSGIDIVTRATGVRDRSLSTTGTVSAMAVTSDRVWFGTGVWNSASASIGYVDRSTWTVSQIPATTDLRSVWAIVPDPAYGTNGRVWVLWNNFGNNSYLASYTAAGGLVLPATTVADLAYSMALGEDDKLYVAGGSTIRRYSLEGSTPTFDTSWSTATCTSSTSTIAAGAAGSQKLYFTGAAGVGPVCSITTSGTVATVGAVSSTPTYYARNIVVGPTGKVWVTTNSPASAVWEIDTSGSPAKNVRLFTGTGIWPLAIDSGGALWVSDASGAWKISL